MMFQRHNKLLDQDTGDLFERRKEQTKLMAGTTRVAYATLTSSQLQSSIATVIPESPASPPPPPVPEYARNLAPPSHHGNSGQDVDKPKMKHTVHVHVKTSSQQAATLAPLPAVSDLFSAHDFELNIDISVVPPGEKLCYCINNIKSIVSHVSSFKYVTSQQNG